MFYLIIFVILLIMSVLEISKIDKWSHKILIQLSWLILVVVAGTRYETGADWDEYIKYLDQVVPIGKFITTGQVGGGVGFEFGYFLFCAFLKQLGLGFQWLMFFVSLFNVSLITKALKNYTHYVVWGLFVYYSLLYITVEFSLIRQAIAASICFYSYKFIEERKLGKFLLLVIIASSFHRSAIIMFPLCLVLQIRFSNTVFVVVTLIGCLVMFLRVPWITSSLMFVGGFLGDDFLHKVIFYTQNSVYSISRKVGLGFFLNIALLFMFLVNRKFIDDKKYGNLFLNLYFANLIVYYYVYEFMEISVRMGLYFIYSLIVLFPILLECCSVYYNRLVWGTVLFLYCAAYNIKIYTNHPTMIVYNPYQNYIVYQVLDKRSVGKKRLDINKEIVRKQRENMKKR